jgi:hypothetical protein
VQLAAGLPCWLLLEKHSLKVDMIVVGNSAVSRNGARLGKGEVGASCSWSCALLVLWLVLEQQSLKVDMLEVGSSAVSRNGVRVGKGEVGAVQGMLVT